MSSNRYTLFVFIVEYCLAVCFTGYGQETVFTVNVGETVGPNTRFWQAAGHDYLFHYVNTPIGRSFLDRAEDMASIRYLRTHFTFNTTRSDRDVPGVTVGGDVARIGPDGEVTYDFSKVNQTYREFVNRGMKPIVEFGFFPDGFARDFGPPREDNRGGDHEREAVPIDWKRWEALQHAFMQNLEDEFGKEELKTWYFEVWNEPDKWPLKHLDVFFRMYDQFAQVVKSYDADYQVGGPGCYTPVFLDHFLRHIETGKNFITGETGSPLDFVSYHLYGISGKWLNELPSVLPRVSFFIRELRWLKRILEGYPKARAAEFHLNEWGLSSRFRRAVDRFPELEYRNNHFSPLFMVKLVDQLYALGDHGSLRTDLLLYWGFTWEAERGRLFHGNRELFTGGGVVKPILTGYEMLARLKDNRLTVEGPRPGGRLGILATREKDQIAFILYNFEEADDALGQVDSVDINITGLDEASRLEWMTTELSVDKNNSYMRWLSAGRPEIDSLSPESIDAMNRLEVSSSSETSVRAGRAQINLQLQRHAMVLIEASILP